MSFEFVIPDSSQVLDFRYVKDGKEGHAVLVGFGIEDGKAVPILYPEPPKGATLLYTLGNEANGIWDLQGNRYSCVARAIEALS